MSALLLAPYNDSMRLGQGYNSFLQVPCLGNAVDISESMLAGSRTTDGLSQTVAYSSSFVEKMSEVVRSMNISAGSSIRTGSVAVSGGGSSIDEIKFAESDLNAVLSVKVVNQTRSLRDNIQFLPVDVENMDSEKFHEVYGDTFISGFMEGGDLHGIISIKALDASKKSEIRSTLKGQFNGTNSEWSPTTTGSMGEALQQTEVTVTVNWSGGGAIKPPSEEWTIDSLVRAASSFPDNVSKCPQRTWAILTRYDTVPNFIEFANKPNPPIKVRRYEGVQRYTSDLLDMYIEYKTNLLVVNDAMRHPEHYEESKREDHVFLTVESLVKERRLLKAEMAKIVGRIELLDKDPLKIVSLQMTDDVVAPELWRARLPFRVERAEGGSVQDVLQRLKADLPLDAATSEITHGSSLASELQLKEALLKIETLEMAKTSFTDQLDAAQAKLKVLETSLTDSKTERTALTNQLASAQVKLKGLETTSTKSQTELTTKDSDITAINRQLTAKSDALSKAEKRVGELEALVPVSLTEGLCRPSQLTTLPPCAKAWVEENSSELKDCRISWAWAGNRDIDEEGSDNFAASTDDVGPDDYIKKVTTYRNKKFLRGVSVLYRCGKEVQHGTCGDASDTSESYELAENEHFIQGTVHESDKAQFDTPVVDSLRLFTNLGWRFWPKCEEENDGDSHSGLAPPGYVLKGFWTQHGEALDRLGLIWTKLPGGLDPDSSPFHYLWP